LADLKGRKVKKDWLRGCKLRTFKKWFGYVNNDGIYYSVSDYEKLIIDGKKMKIGDDIYNIYLNKTEKIKQINRKWQHIIHGSRNGRILYIDYTTETGYIIYDVNDVMFKEDK